MFIIDKYLFLHLNFSSVVVNIFLLTFSFLVFMKGVFWILLFLVAGEVVSMLIGGMLPGNVLGMLLLFLALVLGWIKLQEVSGIAHLLTKNMALFFVPASVGIITSWNIISHNLFALLLISVVTTLLVIAVVAIVQQRLEEKKMDTKIGDLLHKIFKVKTSPPSVNTK